MFCKYSNQEQKANEMYYSLRIARSLRGSWIRDQLSLRRIISYQAAMAQYTKRHILLSSLISVENSTPVDYW